MSKLPSADQVLDAIAQIHLKQTYPDGFTTQEFASSAECGFPSARNKIGLLIRAGMAKHVGFKPTIRMDGRPNKVPVYILLEPPLDTSSNSSSVCK